jgi:hypothetical protein
MATKGFFTGMRGVFLVAAELSHQHFIVSPTSRGAAGADLLVTDELCKRAFSVQVKTNAKAFGFWLLNKQAMELISPTYIYVLVNLRKNGVNEFFIVPSKVIAQKTLKEESKGGIFYSFSYSDADPYKDNWHLFGEP